MSISSIVLWLYYIIVVIIMHLCRPLVNKKLNVLNKAGLAGEDFSTADSTLFNKVTRIIFYVYYHKHIFIGGRWSVNTGWLL